MIHVLRVGLVINSPGWCHDSTKELASLRVNGYLVKASSNPFIFYDSPLPGVNTPWKVMRIAITWIDGSSADLELLDAADVLHFMLCCCKDHFCCSGVSAVFIVPADHRVLLVSMDVAAADLVLAACVLVCYQSILLHFEDLSRILALTKSKPRLGEDCWELLKRLSVVPAARENCFCW